MKKQKETENKNRWSMISNLAVIISLIFVIFELRQNHKALEEANTIARMESANDAYTGSTMMRQLIIENASIWNKANKGIPLNEDETLIRKMISHTWYFNHGQMYEQAVRLNDKKLISARISIPERFVPTYPGIRADWLSVKSEFIAKGYSALIAPYEKAFKELDNDKAKKDAKSSTSIHDAAVEGNIEIVKKYLDDGNDVDFKNYDFMTPLHFAAIGGHKEIAELLITKGADVNVKGIGGWTPLHGAAANGHKEIAELLMANGAKINSIYSSHEETDSELDFALSNNHQITTDFLRKKGAKTAEELKAEGK